MAKSKIPDEVKAEAKKLGVTPTQLWNFYRGLAPLEGEPEPETEKKEK